MSSIICTTLLCGFIYLIFGRNSAECISIIQIGWFLKKIWKLFCVLFRSKNGFLFQYTLLAKPELLPYPFSSTRTSLHPLRSIRNLNGNPDKNASNVENLGYFRNLRVSETSVGAIILDSRILTTIRMRSLLQKALWSGKHEIAWRRQKAETDKFKIHPFTINSKMRECARRET